MLPLQAFCGNNAQEAMRSDLQNELHELGDKAPMHARLVSEVVRNGALDSAEPSQPGIAHG